MNVVKEASSMNLKGAARVGGAPQGITFALTGFLPVMAIVSLAPAIPSIARHFADIPNASVLVPVMVTAPGAMLALCSPIAGWAADRIGRRLIILIATFTYGVVGTASFFVQHLASIFVLRLGLGITEAVILTAVNTLVVDYFTPDGRRKWLTVQGILGPILGTVCITVSGALTDRYWNGAFLVYLFAFPLFVAMLFVFFEPAVVPRDEREASLIATPFPTRTVVAFCLTTLFVAILFYVFYVQVGLAFEAVGVISPARLGVLIGLAGLGVPFGALSFGFFSKTWSNASLVALVLASLGVGLAGIGFSRDYRWMMAFSVIEQYGTGTAVVSLIYWVSKVMPPQHRGRGMGWWGGCFFAGQFLSPAVVGLVRGFSGSILSAFVIMGTTGILGAFAALAASRSRSSIASAKAE